MCIRDRIKDEAEKMAGGLGDKTLRIGAKVGENGRIFGSVNTIMIADALKAIGFEVDRKSIKLKGCLLYTSDAADERSSVDLGGRRIIQKKKKREYKRD